VQIEERAGRGSEAGAEERGERKRKREKEGKWCGREGEGERRQKGRATKSEYHFIVEKKAHTHAC